MPLSQQKTIMKKKSQEEPSHGYSSRIRTSGNRSYLNMSCRNLQQLNRSHHSRKIGVRKEFEYSEKLLKISDRNEAYVYECASR